MLEWWTKKEMNGRELWVHDSGACVYESSFWAKEKEQLRLIGEDVSTFPTWKAHRASEVPGEWDEDDDGLLYMTIEDAMIGALTPSKYTETN